MSPARRARSPGADALDPLIKVVGEHRVQCMAGALGQLLDVEVSVLGKLPHRLLRVREERGFGAQQLLAGYTGRSVEHRGERAEQAAAWSMTELQELLDEWIVAAWQNRPHDGLRHPLMPGKALTPNAKYAALALPLAGEREREGGDEGEPPGDLPAAGTGHQPLQLRQAAPQEHSDDDVAGPPRR